MHKNYPTPYQRKILWRALTGVSLFVIAALFVLSVLLFSEVLGYLQPVLIPLAVAGIIAYLLDPLVAWFQKRGLSRLRSVLCVFGSFFAAAVIFLALIIPPIVQQIGNQTKQHNVGENITKKLNELREVSWINPLADYLLDPVEQVGTESNQIATEATNQQSSIADKNHNTSSDAVDGAINDVPFIETRLGNAITSNKERIFATVTSVITKGTGAMIFYLGLLIGFIMIPIYLYYFLTESAAIKDNWHHYVPLKASKFKTEVIDTLKEINGYLIAFFRGQVLVAFIDGVLVGITLEIFGLPYGLAIGVLMAFLGVIPFVGNLICLIPACIIAFVHFSVVKNQYYFDEGVYLKTIEAGEVYAGHSPWIYVGSVVAIFLIVQQINSLITAPKIVGDSVGLHPMTVIFSMLFWSLVLGGFVGALLAVPLTAALKVIFVRYIWEKRIMDTPEEEILETDEVAPA